MSRIVTAIGHGTYKTDPLPIPYLVFEVAKGSLKIIKAKSSIDLGWKLGTIHGLLVALSQLHKVDIVHQDIKPSNILIFEKENTKLADLGNATKLGNKSPRWNKECHCGDHSYAPIELLYRYYSLDWKIRRVGADFFMAGGIITYLLTDVDFLALLVSNIPEPYKYYNGCTFDEAKVHLIEAHNKTIAEVREGIDESIREDLSEVIAQLTYPLPELRGIPKRTIITSLPQFSLQLYISTVDRLAKKVS